MPLTRHLYEIDEVASAQQWCLRNNFTSRAAYWTWELIVSQESEIALDGLRDTWLRYGSGYDPHLITVSPATDDEWLTLVLRICAACIGSPSTTAYVLLNKTAEQPSRTHMTPRPRNQNAATRRKTRSARFVGSLDAAETMDPSDAACWWIALDSACRQGIYKDAFWLLQTVQPTLSANGIWSALQVASRGGEQTAKAITALAHAATAYPQPTKQILYQAAAVLLLCETTAKREPMLAVNASPYQYGHYQRDWISWNALVSNIRAARLYAIPKEALHAGTTRGALDSKYTNIGELREPMAYLVNACRWWRDTVTVAGLEEDSEQGTLCFSDDDELETFMDTHFGVCDLPDEWPKVEQEKSHGRGCANTTAVSPTPVQVRYEAPERRYWNAAIHVRWR
jgi:hypothetical protein